MTRVKMKMGLLLSSTTHAGGGGVSSSSGGSSRYGGPLVRPKHSCSQSLSAPPSYTNHTAQAAIHMGWGHRQN